MDHISFSQLNMLLRCGEQYRRRYVLGEKIPPSGNMVMGKSAHKAEERNFRQKIESKADLPTEAVLDFFSESWEEGKYEVALTPEELGDDSPGKVLGKIKDKGVTLVRVYHEQQAPIACPVEVETTAVVEFEGGFPPLVGIIDRIDEGAIIAENKFLSKMPSEGDILTDIQLTAYQMLYSQKYKEKPSKLIKQVAVATKEPKTRCFEAPPRDQETIDRFLLRLYRAMEAIRAGTFLPAANGAWVCHPKWCGYWNSCRVRP